MTIGRDEVRRIAELANLELESADRTFADSLQSILEYVAILDEVDVSGVEPTSFGATQDSCLREDGPRSGLTAEEALRNAPDGRDGQFRVPGVLDP